MIRYRNSCVVNGMPMNPYETPTTATANSAGPPLRKHLIYFATPVMMLVIPAIAGTIPIWQLPIFMFAGYMMILGGEKLGLWLFKPTKTWRQKAVRWCLYSIPITIWAVSKMHSAFGTVASVATALAVIPGLFIIMFCDRPQQNGPANKSVNRSGDSRRI